MIYAPWSDMYKEAGNISHKRACREHNCTDKQANLMREFQRVARKQVLFSTIAIVLVAVLFVGLAIICFQAVGYGGMILHFCVLLIASTAWSVEMIYSMQLAFYIPIHIQCYHPKQMKRYLLPELGDLLRNMKYALAIGFIACLLQLFDPTEWTSEQKTALHIVYFFVTVGAVWYTALGVRAYRAVNNAILATKKENERWLNEHKYNYE